MCKLSLKADGGAISEQSTVCVRFQHRFYVPVEILKKGPLNKKKICHGRIKVSPSTEWLLKGVSFSFSSLYKLLFSFRTDEAVLMNVKVNRIWERELSGFLGVSSTYQTSSEFCFIVVKLMMFLVLMLEVRRILKYEIKPRSSFYAWW